MTTSGVERIVAVSSGETRASSGLIGPSAAGAARTSRSVGGQGSARESHGPTTPHPSAVVGHGARKTWEKTSDGHGKPEAWISPTSNRTPSKPACQHPRPTSRYAASELADRGLSVADPKRFDPEMPPRRGSPPRPRSEAFQHDGSDRDQARHSKGLRSQATHCRMRGAGPPHAARNGPRSLTPHARGRGRCLTTLTRADCRPQLPDGLDRIACLSARDYRRGPR
jgi:hypothetical protein